MRLDRYVLLNTYLKYQKYLSSRTSTVVNVTPRLFTEYPSLSYAGPLGHSSTSKASQTRYTRKPGTTVSVPTNSQLIANKKQRSRTRRPRHTTIHTAPYTNLEHWSEGHFEAFVQQYHEPQQWKLAPGTRPIAKRPL